MTEAHLKHASHTSGNQGIRTVSASTGREALLRQRLAAMGQAGFSSLQKRIANKISNDRMLSFLQFFRNFQDDIS